MTKSSSLWNMAADRLENDTFLQFDEKCHRWIRRPMLRAVILDDIWWPPLELSLVQTHRLWSACIEPTTPAQNPSWQGYGSSPQTAVNAVWDLLPADRKRDIRQWLNSAGVCDTTERPYQPPPRITAKPFTLRLFIGADTPAGIAATLEEIAKNIRGMEVNENAGAGGHTFMEEDGRDMECVEFDWDLWDTTKADPEAAEAAEEANNESDT